MRDLEGDTDYLQNSEKTEFANGNAPRKRGFLMYVVATQKKSFCGNFKKPIDKQHSIWYTETTIKELENGGTYMRLLNIKRSDYWDCTLNKMVTIYSELTKSQLEEITRDLQELGYEIVSYGAKLREFENRNSYVIIERR